MYENPDALVTRHSQFLGGYFLSISFHKAFCPRLPCYVGCYLVPPCASLSHIHISSSCLLPFFLNPNSKTPYTYIHIHIHTYNPQLFHNNFSADLYVCTTTIFHLIFRTFLSFSFFSLPEGFPSSFLLNSYSLLLYIGGRCCPGHLNREKIFNFALHGQK